jgi:hypothetical protein
MEIKNRDKRVCLELEFDKRDLEDCDLRVGDEIELIFQ